ncbi:hypothetical protein L5876_02385 [Hyphobacterium sp. SN044]|uniref:hypothetical protein n=1 Tax=Hyphobacterium sp. SN044 TaxID=2912575 RepID=UPI001F37EA79|nr:hypothetical protein [Hyphobacterium sp. SN044]MCF8878656.1 hypothetical protein [Hyphobacterium sp. SN044]
MTHKPDTPAEALALTPDEVSRLLSEGWTPDDIEDALAGLAFIEAERNSPDPRAAETRALFEASPERR